MKNSNPQVQTKGPSIVIDDQKLHAYLEIPKNYQLPLIEDDILTQLSGADIKLTDDIKTRVTEVVTAYNNKTELPEPICLASGIEPVEPVDGYFEWAKEFEHTPEDADDGSIDFYQQNRIITVESGTVIGTIHPPRPGKEGTTLFGNPLPPTRRPARIQLQDNVKLDEDEKTVVATHSGQVRFVRNIINIIPVVEINGDVDFSTGHVDSETDVLIHGNVIDLFSVHCKKDISIRGTVEAAQVISHQDITILGGVAAREKGILVANGNINARFINFGYVDCEQDITTGREIMDSFIFCRGQVNMSAGSLIGGVTFARAGIEAKNIGNDAYAKTIVGIGLDPKARLRVQEIDREKDAHQKSLEKLNSLIAPIAKRIKHLTPAQREQATDLLHRTKALQQTIANLDAERRQIFESAAGAEDAGITVLGKIFPNVVLCIEDLIAEIRREIRGPVRIERRNEGKGRLVAVNKLTASVTPIPARIWKNQDAPEIPNPPGLDDAKRYLERPDAPPLDVQEQQAEEQEKPAEPQLASS